MTDWSRAGDDDTILDCKLNTSAVSGEMLDFMAGVETVFDEAEELGNLPNVDDLEVAAAAASAAMEAMQGATASTSDEEESSEDEDSSGEEDGSSSEEESSSSDDEEMQDIEQAPSTSQRVAVSLEVSGEGNIRLHIVPQAEDHEAESDAGSEPFDQDMLREMLGRMEEDGEDARAAAREAAEEESQMSAVQPLDVEISPEDVLLPAGLVSSLLGNMIIVQVDATARPVDEGSILCLTADRTPLGRIEEVFGPIHAPLYALRYAGGGEPPEGLKEGAAVSSVERFNEYLMPEAVQEKARDIVDDEAADEFEFSDDEAEATFRAQYGQPSTSGADSLTARTASGGRGRGPSPQIRGRGRQGGNFSGYVSSPRGGGRRGRGPPYGGAQIDNLSLSSPRQHGGHGASSGVAGEQGFGIQRGAPQRPSNSRGRGRRGNGSGAEQSRGWRPYPEAAPLAGTPPYGHDASEPPQGGQWVFIPAGNQPSAPQLGYPQATQADMWAGNHVPLHGNGRFGPLHGGNGFHQESQGQMGFQGGYQGGSRGGFQEGSQAGFPGGRGFRGGRGSQRGRVYQQGAAEYAGVDFQLSGSFGVGYDIGQGQGTPSSFYPEGLP